MKFFKQFLKSRSSNWESPEPGGCTSISEDKILSVLNEISQSYLTLDANRLSKTLANDAVLESKKYVDGASSIHKHDRYAFINSMYNYKMTRCSFSAYNMTIAEVIVNEPGKWIVDCLVEYKINMPDSAGIEHCSTQRLEFGIQNGWVVVQKAQIVVVV